MLFAETVATRHSEDFIPLKNMLFLLSFSSPCFVTFNTLLNCKLPCECEIGKKGQTFIIFSLVAHFPIFTMLKNRTEITKIFCLSGINYNFYV